MRTAAKRCSTCRHAELPLTDEPCWTCYMGAPVKLYKLWEPASSPRAAAIDTPVIAALLEAMAAVKTS